MSEMTIEQRLARSAYIEKLEAALKPFADAARSFSFAIAPDGIDDGLTVGCVVAVGGLEREAILSTADFNRAAAILREGK